MVIWKWGISLIPILSGVIFGIQKLSSSVSELPPPISLVAPKVEPLSEETLQELKTQRIKEEANSAFKKLDDYTFKLFSSCNMGTGWILDYQLPQEKDKYPLIWYIATNAHVVRRWMFDSNPYEQKLPNNPKHKKLNEYVSKYSLSTIEGCTLARDYGLFDINLSKQVDGEALSSDKGAISRNKMKRPRLFWSALNFLKKDLNWGIKGNNFKDFAVVEIEFTDEASAREITRGFADKYKVDSTEAINIFSDPLDTLKVEENNENFYSLGYPSEKGDNFKYTKSWDEQTLTADQLSEDPRNRYLTNPRGIKLKGHISASQFSKLKFKWGEREYHRMGHFYLLKGMPMGRGSSGSISIDGKGNLLGVRSIGEYGPYAKHSMFIPLRSNELVLKDNFKTPKYDLILGSKNQKSSYRGQVERYITSKGIDTWLSKRGWSHKS